MCVCFYHQGQRSTLKVKPDVLKELKNDNPPERKRVRGINDFEVYYRNELLKVRQAWYDLYDSQ